MLSLKYIAMLLQRNPNIQGAEGSEYRLFTVALMLGKGFYGMFEKGTMTKMGDFG